MKTDNNLFTKAQELRSQGYSYQEIADELDSSKATIHRLLAGETKIRDEVETFQERSNKTSHTAKTDEKANEYGSEHTKLKLKELELAHEREMYKLKQKDKEIELERMKTEQIHYDRREKQEQDEQKLERRKKHLLREFKKLIEQIKDACEDATWWKEELQTFIGRVVRRKEEIEEFISLETDFEPENNAVCSVLDRIESELNEIIEEAEEKEEKRKQREKRNNKNEEDSEDEEDEDDIEITVDLTYDSLEMLELALSFEDLCREIKRPSR